MAVGEFDQTVGAILMGVILNTYLLGVVIPQFFTYEYSNYKDPWWIRTGVAILFTINVVHGASVIYMAWWYCVTIFNQPEMVAASLWPLPVTALCTAVLAIANQLFQSWRIYVFTKNTVLAVSLVLASVATCGMGLAAAIQSWIITEVTKLVALGPIVTANLSLQLAIDLIIAGILSYNFSKSKTSFKKTDKVLNQLIRTAVRSGAFTAVFALGTLLAFRLAPGTYMHAICAIPIGRIYTHTLMDHFISREELRKILSNNGNIVSVPNFTTNNGGLSVGGAAEGTSIMLRDTRSQSLSSKGSEPLKSHV
ncbi:hypothetical protein C8R47DRAFT_1086200 [Mycena vitilis]|nr:hypothetical protein C8R47DRAFT_1086200 [Mycena vitilis]